MLRLLLPLMVSLALPALAQDDLSEELVRSRGDGGQPQQTGWLELVKGYKGDVMGAEVREVTSEPGQGRQLIIAIPKVQLADRDAIEEVRVVGRAPEKDEPVFDFNLLQYEWVDDYDNDYYGLLIRYDDETSMPIRLYMHSRHGSIR